MTEIPLKLKKWLKYPQNLKNDKNTPTPKKWQKYPQNIKINKIYPKPKKWPKYPWNLKNDWNTSKT